MLKISISRIDKFIRILIEDSGPGMSDKIRARIFEPFYSTRVGARGMGLALSYFIITDIHKGNINVKSREGKGTVFTIDLPVN